MNPDGSQADQFEKSIWASIRLFEQYKTLLTLKKDDVLDVEQQILEIDGNICSLKLVLKGIS
jgi:hypothetical protein